MLGECLDQRRLATARLAGDKDHASLAIQRRVQKSAECFQLTLSSDKERLLDHYFILQEGWECGRGNRAATGRQLLGLLLPRVGQWRDLPFLDSLVEQDCGFLGPDAELLLEYRGAFRILAQGRRALAGPGMEAHQLTMGRLVQGIEGQPAPGKADGWFELAVDTVPAHQSLQGIGQFPAQRLGLQELPIIKVGAILQAEAAQKVTPDQGHCIGQGSYTGGAGLRCRVPVGVALGQVLPELGHIHPERLSSAGRAASRGIEPDLLPIDLQPGPVKGFTEGVKRATQGGPAAGAVVLGPEQVDQGIAPVALARDGKVNEKGDGFAPVELDRRAVALDMWWSEEIESKAGHHCTSLITSVLESRRKVNGMWACLLSDRIFTWF